MSETQRKKLRGFVNKLVVRRDLILLSACLAISLGLGVGFALVHVMPCATISFCASAVYVYLLCIRRSFSEGTLLVSCLVVDLYATAMIAILGNNTGFDFYIFGVISVVFILAPNSGNFRYLYQLLGFVSLGAAHGMASHPHLAFTPVCRELFAPYYHDMWYINFAIAFFVVMGSSFFYAQSAEKSREELEGAANNDELTQLHNRHYTVPLLKGMEADYSLFILDIDDFKKVNDTFGHDAGDATLRAVAECLRDCVRRGDEVSRWGGEEFIVVLPSCPLTAAANVAETIRASIERLSIPRYEDVHVTVSIGLTDSRRRSWEKVVREADRLLYFGKNNGKNAVISIVTPSGHRTKTPTATPKADEVAGSATDAGEDAEG